MRGLVLRSARVNHIVTLTPATMTPEAVHNLSIAGLLRALGDKLESEHTRLRETPLLHAFSESLPESEASTPLPSNRWVLD